MKTRADKIFNLLKTNGGRLRVFELFELLAEMDGTSELQANVISSTVHSDNNTREMQGRAPRFNRYGDRTEYFYQLAPFSTICTLCFSFTIATEEALFVKIKDNR